MRTFFSLLCLLIALLASFGASISILWQHRANTQFQPTPCTITASSVQEHRSRRSRTYSPEITYQYTDKGIEYTSKQVCPTSENGSQTWAQNIVNRFPVTNFLHLPEEWAKKPTATAFVDPQNPEESILVKQYSFEPYAFAIFSAVAAALALGFLTRTIAGSRNTMAAIPLDDSASRLLLPKISLTSPRYRASLAWFLGFTIAILFPAMHWLFIIDRSLKGLEPISFYAPTIFLTVIGFTSTLFLVTAVRRWSLTRHISDARLRAQPIPMRRGERFFIDVEADAYSPLRVSSAKARIICTEHYMEKRGNKTQYSTRTASEQTATLSQPAQIPAGQTFTGSAEVTFDAGIPPTSPITKPRQYPYHTWEIRLDIELEGAVDYHSVFPLEVA